MALHNRGLTLKLKHFLIIVLPAFIMPVLSQDVNASLDRARAAGFVPHKALYEIQMHSKKSSAKISNIHGKMMYEWTSSCDAWVSNHQFDMTYEYIEAPAVRITSDFSNYESFDGKDFNYTVTRKAGDVVLGEVRGGVSGDVNTGGGKAVYSKPVSQEFDLPKGTLFPMAHTLDVFDKIKTGKKFYNATIFDGSDENGPVDVNSFIGKEVSFPIPEEHKGNIDHSLTNVTGWNVRLAFFPLNEYSETAEYEMSLKFHENGVISDMLIEYDDFSVSQKLVALEKKDGNCEDGEPKN